MNFREWVKEIKKSMDSDIPEDLVCEVLVTAFRTAFEEFMAARNGGKPLDTAPGNSARYCLSDSMYLIGKSL